MRRPKGLLSLVLSFLLLSGTALGAEAPNFSGSFVYTPGKGDNKLKKKLVITLKVVQSDTRLDISRAVEGREFISNFILPSGEGVCETSGGLSGNGTAHFKGKRLFLECLVVGSPDPSQPPVPVRIKERWELSTDSKTLTIHRDVEFPGYEALGEIIPPETEKYTRQ